VTDGMLRMLRSARRWTDNPETSGVAPRGAGQATVIRSLVRLGFVEYTGEYGSSEDDDKERPIYAITPAGRSALAASRSR
jgi:hypothetical protein